MDFGALAQELLSRSESCVREWLPDGKKRGHEWVVGGLNGESGGSLSINLNSGKWADFATGDKGGDLISLYAAIQGIDQGEAYKQLARDDFKAAHQPSKPKPKPTPDRVVVAPVPAESAHCNCHHFKLGDPVAVWTYLDRSSLVLGYIARYEPAGERKQIVPWTYDGKKWGMGQWPEPRPMYGLEFLIANPNKPILLVEGEKAADAARKFAGHVYVVMTWPGGSKAFQKVDFSPIHGRKVLLWPDADFPGVGAMREIGQRLLSKCPEVKIIDVSNMNDGWDAADSGFDWSEFKNWASSRVSLLGIPVADPAPVPAVVSAQSPMAPVDLFADLPDITEKGRVLETIENVREICRRLHVTIRYNVISKEEEILIPGEAFSVDNRENASLAWLTSWCARMRMPTGKLSDFVTYLADQNLYNPVAQWIDSQPWDGVTRLPALFDTITAVGEDSNQTIRSMKETLMRRWLISAAAAVYEPHGVSAHGILVFQGEQYLGKTKWFKSLVPESLNVIQDGMMLRPDDRDSIKQICSFWLVELGELDATFRKADIAQLKAFITRKSDVIRRAYARKESYFARRTIFFASVNTREFLHDSTGNRRYWTIECAAINHSHDIDMQQLWAEVATLYKGGEGHYLLPEEMAGLNFHNEGFMAIDPIEERIQVRFDWDEPSSLWKWKTATEILIDAGVERPNQSDAAKASAIVRRLNGNQARRYSGKNQLLCPSTRVYG